MEWISVKDRLPLDEKRVMIWWLKGDDDERHQPIPAVRFGRYIEVLNQWRPEGCMGNYNEQITHWAVIPSGPKVEK